MEDPLGYRPLNVDRSRHASPKYGVRYRNRTGRERFIGLVVYRYRDHPSHPTIPMCTPFPFPGKCVSVHVCVPRASERNGGVGDEFFSGRILCYTGMGDLPRPPMRGRNRDGVRGGGPHRNEVWRDSKERGESPSDEVKGLGGVLFGFHAPVGSVRVNGPEDFLSTVLCTSRLSVEEKYRQSEPVDGCRSPVVSVEEGRSQRCQRPKSWSTYTVSDTSYF